VSKEKKLIPIKKPHAQTSGSNAHFLSNVRLKAAAYNATFRGLLKPTNIPQPHTWLPDCIVFLMPCGPAIRLPRTSRVSVSFSRGSQDIVFDDSRPWHMLEDRFRLIRYIGAAAAAPTLRDLFCNHPAGFEARCYEETKFCLFLAFLPF
jgi:hypothetical protein